MSDVEETIMIVEGLEEDGPGAAAPDIRVGGASTSFLPRSI